MNKLFHGGQLQEVQSGGQSLEDFSVNVHWDTPQVDDATWILWQKSLYNYPDLSDYRLRDQIASLYSISNEDICVTAGAMEGLSLAIRAITPQVKSCYLRVPCFTEYHYLCKQSGLPVEEFESLRMDLGRLENVEEGTLVILGNPNNPTGDALSREALLQLIRNSPKAYWIIDESFIELSDGGERSLLNQCSEHENVCVVRTFTKSWGVPGLRLGFSCSGNKDWLRRMHCLQLPWSIHAIAYQWGLHSCNEEELARLQVSWDAIKEYRMMLVDALGAISAIKALPSHTNFVLCQIDKGYEGSIKRLLDLGFHVRTCLDFAGLERGDFIRIAVKQPEQNDALIKVLKKVF